MMTNISKKNTKSKISDCMQLNMSLSLWLSSAGGRFLKGDYNAIIHTILIGEALMSGKFSLIFCIKKLKPTHQSKQLPRV